MNFSSAFIVCFARTYSCWFRMFIRKLSVLQVHLHIVVGSEYSWSKWILENKCTAKTHGQNEYSEPTILCTWKTENFLMNIRNQQLYVLAKQKINALLKLMVKMNTRNSCWFRMFIRKFSVFQVHRIVGSEYSFWPWVLAVHLLSVAMLKLMVKMNTRNLQLYVLAKQTIF
jgi:hypothetical protein